MVRAPDSSNRYLLAVWRPSCATSTSKSQLINSLHHLSTHRWPLNAVLFSPTSSTSGLELFVCSIVHETHHYVRQLFDPWSFRHESDGTCSDFRHSHPKLHSCVMRRVMVSGENLEAAEDRGSADIH